MVSNVQRIGWKLCDQRLLQFVFRYNFNRDRKLGRLSKQSTLWVWKERAANKLATEHLLAVPWPKASTPPNVRLTCIGSSSASPSGRVEHVPRHGMHTLWLWLFGLLLFVDVDSQPFAHAPPNASQRRQLFNCLKHSVCRSCSPVFAPPLASRFPKRT